MNSGAFSPDATIGCLYGPAMKIESQEEADAYFERLVAYSISFGNSREKAEGIERANLGYYAGYYDNATRRRVERLFQCHHPIFGPCSLIGGPTFEQAYQAGRDVAEDIDGNKDAS